jgi:uncharacterized membrane-anchored protein
MEFFKLTIAEDAISKKTQHYKNLQAMRGSLMISLSVAVVSGFWYFLVSHEINWNASQVVLVLHLAAGGVSLLVMAVYFILHQKDKGQRWWQFLAPWTMKQQPDETRQHLSQRWLGVVLTWLFISIYATGVLIAIPGLLFYFNIIWMQDYYVFQQLNLLHIGASVLVLPVFLLHLLWILRKAHH